MKSKFDLEFQTPQFKWSESELKGNKEYFVEGFVSTTDVDDFNEIVTENAQNKIVSEIKGKVITMDIGHSEWIADSGSQHANKKPASNLIPVAKVVEAERRDNGTFIKAKLNPHSPKFKEIWGSIKDGFLHSFSIAFHPLKAITKEISGKIMRFIDDLNLLNITITGVPVNSNATLRPVLKAFLNNEECYNNIKGEIMTNNIPPVTPAPISPVAPVVPATTPPTTPPVAPVEPVPPVAPAPAADPAVPVEPVPPVVPALSPEEQTKVIKELEDKQVAQKKEVDDLTSKLAAAETSKVEYDKKLAEITASGKPAGMQASPLQNIKSKIESTDRDIALLKAKLQEPVLKGHIEQPNGTNNNIEPETGTASLINKI